jgi:hypothetical protein
MRFAQPITLPLRGAGRHVDRCCRMILGTLAHFRHFRHLHGEAFLRVEVLGDGPRCASFRRTLAQPPLS